MTYVFDQKPTAKAIGAKAYNLYRLQEFGFNVPAFFVVRPTSNPDHNALAKEVTLHLTKKFPKATHFAVRSSASAEDQDSASFAGQFETFLNVPGDKVPAKVLACLESVSSPSAGAYAQKHSLPANPEMSVIVQEMVEADFSGVAFSANPHGLLNEYVITVGSGLGNQVVSDKVPTTTYYFGTADRTSYFEAQNEAPQLKPEILDELTRKIAAATKHFGTYIDLEFAVRREKLYLLQVRPITTIDDSQLTILDNSNIVESYPGITLPLTTSFAKSAYHRVFRGAMARGLSDRATVARYEPVLSHMVESVNGRMYYRISNWYALIQFLPFSNRILPVWQDMLDIHNRQHTIPAEYRKPPNRLREIVSVFRGLQMLLTLPGKMVRLDANFKTIQADFQKRYKPSLSSRQALALYHYVSTRVLKDWDLTLSNDLYAFAFTGLLKRQLGNKSTDKSANQLLSSLGNLESAKPVLGVITLAEIAHNYGLLPELSELKNEDDLNEYLHTHHSPFTEQLDAYIKDFGDRSLEELKLESRTFRTSPYLLLQTVVAYGSDQERLAAVKRSLEPAKHPLKGSWLVRFYRSRAALGIANREQSRLNRSRVFGMVRTTFLTIAARFVEEERLDQVEDIFYLTVGEVEKGVINTALNLKDIVAERRIEYELYRRLPAYSRMVFAGEPFSKHHQSVDSTPIAAAPGQLTGTPCSHGVAEGEALVVSGPTDTSAAKDKILVTKSTDPGWVFMLAVAKGVIAEKGSMLSHTAIITRELGIPSVVGVTGATATLKSGDRIRLDGDTGRIEVLA